MITDIVELQSGNDSGGMTGKSVARRIDKHQTARPSSHACLGKTSVVVRYDGVDPNPALQALARCSNGGKRIVQLLFAGEECGPIGEGPAIVLCMSNLHTVRREFFHERDHF